MSDFNLKEFRRLNKLGRLEFAEKLGISVHTLDSWELGKRNIPQSKIKLINELFKYHINLSNNEDLNYNQDVESLKDEILILKEQISFLKEENFYLKETIIKNIDIVDSNLKELKEYIYLNDKLEYAKKAVQNSNQVKK